MPVLQRSAGILLHPTSLPGDYCIGEIGRQAHRFLEELAAAGQSLWQVLPLGPTGYGNSPYQSPSTFAGNPLLIGFDMLLEEGLLAPEDVREIPWLEPDHVDFGAATWYRPPILKQACRRFMESTETDAGLCAAFETFCLEQAHWLDNYALFTAIKESQGLKPWYAWPRPLAQRDPAALVMAADELADAITDVKILQFLFDRQWRALQAQAAKLGIQIIGDIPIFVAHDSADVWAERELFFLDAKGDPTVVAGVPPDYFSATGQLWGNPLYDWQHHKSTGYAWWIRRLRKILQWVDLVRIDHFRGFAAYWEVPAGEETAINGRWIGGPGEDFFHALQREFGTNLPIIAEDLGVITPDVEELRDRFELPGMRVLQFAFGEDSLAEAYIPENYPANSVAYTGTHDNDTTMGLIQSEAGEGSTRTPQQIAAELAMIRAYTGTDASELNWDYINAICRSEAAFAIYPLQDVLGQGSAARMNTPGIAEGNWEWRFQWEQLTSDVMHRLKRIAGNTGRIPCADIPEG
jgi:4-alpha-glucanotransferase